MELIFFLLMAVIVAMCIAAISMHLNGRKAAAWVCMAIVVISLITFVVGARTGKFKERQAEVKAKFEVTYTVYYSASVAKTFTKIVDEKVYLQSHRGINRLLSGYNQILETTAPIEVVSVRRIQNEIP
jgi:phosphatidylserine synthase